MSSAQVIEHFISLTRATQTVTVIPSRGSEVGRDSKVLRGEEKQRMTDSVALRAFSMTIAEAKAAHVCIRCKRAPETRIYSAHGKKEYTMSAMCEMCFDEVAAASGDVITFAAASTANPKDHVEEAIAYILRQQAAAANRQG